VAPGGGRLINTGSWVHEPGFVGRGASDNPYWPGRTVLLADDRPPELCGLLDSVSPETLRGR
jgi:hypothetical protein